MYVCMYVYILSIEGGSSRSHYVEESFLEEALDLSSDRLLMMMMICIYFN